MEVHDFQPCSLAIVAIALEGAWAELHGNCGFKSYVNHVASLVVTFSIGPSCALTAELTTIRQVAAKGRSLRRGCWSSKRIMLFGLKQLSNRQLAVCSSGPHRPQSIRKAQRRQC